MARKAAQVKQDEYIPFTAEMLANGVKSKSTLYYQTSSSTPKVKVLAAEWSGRFFGGGQFVLLTLDGGRKVLASPYIHLNM